MGAKVYNVGYSASFVETLAECYTKRYKQNPLALSDVLFLMPNRRSCLSLKEAFLQTMGFAPFLLPKIVPIGNIDEDEIFFFGEAEVLSNLPAAISPEERLFLFAKLISSSNHYHGVQKPSFAQSLALADNLGKLIDQTYEQDVSFDNLEKIVPAQYATHWQETLRFLKIVTQFWPEILNERNAIDAVKRKQILLEQQALNWLKNPPTSPIVAAGLSVATKGLKQILKSLFCLSNAEIYIHGLDRQLSDSAFENIEPTHPQFEKKAILDLFNLRRDEVIEVHTKINRARETLVSEMMRSATTSLEWQNLKNNSDILQGLEGLHVIETKNSFEEAECTALIMRQTLETPSKTAALVTTDRNLARMVANILKRFDIDIDDSAGLPLHLSPIGIYLRQILDVLENNFSEVSTAALLKNPDTKLLLDNGLLLSKVRENEIKKRTPSFDTQPHQNEDDTLLKMIKERFGVMYALYQKPEVSLKTLITEHITLAQNLAENNELSGSDRLWRFEDGRQCASFLTKLIEYADIAGDINPKEYQAVLTALLATQTVRKSYGTHPRLKILGPIEARFNKYDVMIVGSLNEGVFPSLPTADPFMSRPMKKDFGLVLPEHTIGILSDDLSSFMCCNEVYLTRAERVSGTPMSRSRYLLRLSTVLKGFDLDLSDLNASFYQTLANKIEIPASQDIYQIKPAAPKPPVSSRPRKLSATTIQKLMTDPYEVYARYILKLKPLNELDDVLTQNNYGSIVHKILERFNEIYPSSFDGNALKTLLDLGKKEFEQYELQTSQKAFWLARFEKTAKWLIDFEMPYRQNVYLTHHEITGNITFNAPNGPIIIEARADRIDEFKDGTYHIIDYKTGRFPTAKQVLSGYAPQLLIEALIAQSGGFKTKTNTLKAREVSSVSYFGLSGKIVTIEKELPRLLEETSAHIQLLINAFDNEDTPYLPRPNSKHANPYPDYEHLSRLKEYFIEEDNND